MNTTIPKSINYDFKFVILMMQNLVFGLAFLSIGVFLIKMCLQGGLFSFPMLFGFGASASGLMSLYNIFKQEIISIQEDKLLVYNLFGTLKQSILVEEIVSWEENEIQQRWFPYKALSVYTQNDTFILFDYQVFGFNYKKIKRILTENKPEKDKIILTAPEGNTGKLLPILSLILGFFLGIMLFLWVFAMGNGAYTAYSLSKMTVNDLVYKEMVLDSLWKIDTIHRNATPATDYYATWQSEKYIERIEKEEYGALSQIPLHDTAVYYFSAANDLKSNHEIKHLVYKDKILIDWNVSNKRWQGKLTLLTSLAALFCFVFIVYCSIYIYFFSKKIKLILTENKPEKS
jgi:hypothetical protein